MKKHLLLLLVLISFTRTASAQFNVYHPFPDSNAWWREQTWRDVYCNHTNTTATNDFDFHLTGDTLIKGIKYHKLNISGGYQLAIPCSPPFIGQDYDNIIGFIREDTMKHIFLRPTNGSRDTLLYNFNLKVGDTLPDTYNNNKLNGNTVYAIDSILIGAAYRKQFLIRNAHFSNWTYDSLIEGIGSTLGLLEVMLPPFEGGSKLNCFKQNDTTVYPHLNDNCDMFYLNVPAIKNSQVKFTLYPNPANTKVTLLYQLPQSQHTALLNLYNTVGQLVKTESIYTNAGTLTEDVSALSGGIYYYTITVGGSVGAASKLVIIR